MNIIDIIKRPVVTEKATQLKAAANQYVFAVASRATKGEIRHAVERLFRVRVDDVHTVNVPGRSRRSLRSGRRSRTVHDWKKAIVTVRKGEKIELFEGV